MKYAWIAEQGLRYPLVDLCEVLDVSISGYRAWKRGGRPDRQRLTDALMLALIQAIHARHKRRYKVTTDSKHGLAVADNLQ